MKRYRAGDARGCAFFVASHYYLPVCRFAGFEDELVRNGDCYRGTVYRDAYRRRYREFCDRSASRKADAMETR